MGHDAAGTGAIIEIEEPPALADQRLVQLQRELRIREREERAARREMARLTEHLIRHSRAARAQIEQARAEGSAALERVRVEDAAELERQRVHAASQVGQERARARAELENTRAELAERDGTISRLCAELEAANGELAGVKSELEHAENELGSLHRQIEGASRSHAREAAEHTARIRQLEQTVSALSVGLRQTRDDIERAASSRAWRLGHLLTRTLSRLARRPMRTQGALAAALVRIDRVQSAVHALPAGQAGDGVGDGISRDPSTFRSGGVGVNGSGPDGRGGGDVSFSALNTFGSKGVGVEGVRAGEGEGFLSTLNTLGSGLVSVDRARREALAARLRERFGAVPQREQWPLVSAVVLTRNGLHHLERLFAGLIEHTSYPALEVIVIDNASTDATLDYLNSLETPFPLTVIANEDNLSFAAANARGAQQATGELLLFLNNDIEPFEAGWLQELVCALDSDGVEAVGATLLHPEDAGATLLHPEDAGATLLHPEAAAATLLHPEDAALAGAFSSTGGLASSGADGLTEYAQPLVQHRAIRFRWQDDMIKGFNHGDGEGLWEGSLGTDTRAPAVTAACMLVSSDSFARVGGFDGRYRYGTEDVDLGLKLLARGSECVGVGRSVLYHRESSTQNRASSDFRRLNRLENRRLFLERWAPLVRREYRVAKLRCDPFWTDGAGAHIAITLTSLDVADGWGDWYSGHEIGDALEQLGWRVSYIERKGDRWYELPEELDYVLSLMDPFDLRRVPAHITTIAWIRNWTERWLERPWFERADVLLASSQGTAELIEARTGRNTIRFPLAVNPARFRPRSAAERLAAVERPLAASNGSAGSNGSGGGPRAIDSDGFAADYVFTGNWWGVDRDIQRALAPHAGERVAIYGKDWSQVPELAPYARGELPYEQLPLLYPSAKLVLDDTQGPTLPYGALNARVFDALACGTLPITNCVAGVRELFDEDFPVWDSRESLRATLDELLSDRPRRDALVSRYRETVLTRHTYAHRAGELREILAAHEQLLSFCLKIGAPSRAVAPTWGDLHYAESIARELRRRGHRVLVQTLDEWEDEDGLSYDVIVHLKGLSRFYPKPGQFNVLWSISHPEVLTGEECDGYDLIAVASPLFAAQLRERTGTPVVVLEQATDPWVMRPDPSPELAHELVYVANSRNVLRPIARDLLPTQRDLAIWGTGWAPLIDTSRVIAEHLPNAELHRVYSSAGIVLNDHWEDMREHGYISNRVYDALACGALVLSDDVPGLTERFGDAVAVYRSRAELHDLIERFLADPTERARRGEAGRAAVLAEHTFAHRVDSLLAFVHEQCRSPRHARRVRAAAV